MWEKAILLLLHSVEAVVASQCWQGAIFSEAVVSPVVQTGGVLRVPGVASLAQCVAAGCDLPDYDLVWMLEGRCYILSCRQRGYCQPRQRPGTDSVLVFLKRASPQTLVLQSLVRPLLRSSEAPGDLEDLDLLDGPPQEFSDPSMLDAEDPEGDQEETGGTGSLEGRDGFNQSEAEDGPEGGRAHSNVVQNRSSSGGTIPQGDDETWRPDAAAEKMNKTQSSVDSTTVSSQRDHVGTSLPTPDTPHWPISTSIQPAADRPLIVSGGNPVEQTLPTVKLDASVSPGPTTDVLKLLQSAVRAPPTATHPPDSPLTSDTTTTTHPPDRPLSSDATITQTPSTNPPTAATADSVSEVRWSNRGPVAVVGPDRKLLLPVSSLSLDGSGSTDDRGIVSYHWDVVSGLPGLKLEGADQAVVSATGLRVGRYTFRLTVSDQQGATDRASLTVRVQEATSPPPVAHASGSHTVSLPNSSLVLRGSMTDGDQTEVHYLWVRDSQSPAAGDVLYGSVTQASLYLANLVEGTYLFQLRVTDAQGRSSTATATVEVQPELGGGEEMELEMLVSVSQVSVAQRDTVVRQLAAMIHVLDRDIQVRGLQGHSHLSTVLRFSVRGPSGIGPNPNPGSRLVGLLRNQLLREKSDYLLFRVLRVDTALCLLRCSGRGQCDPITKECACDSFWTENLIRRYLGDGENNCEWRVLYVILTSFMLVVFILSITWTFICCCRRRRQTKVRKKTKYTILDNMDDQERVELRPKFSIKHRSTEHNSSLMMSESELDSDQDTVFSRDRPVRSRNRVSTHAARNGNAFG
ncbi:dyslexia-associated protein KIAA0319 homolog isoform X2 [Anarrhichthys ocellatus]|nr:dyslexia-associated protein KIAA0319 homolog isoform X2 [Anarrhichthys ocellatus]XP_031735487.1 dyslexia-associated protein KIAA0319 homolog isoform X2 [Anarrhichthys ocellatus]XP_031735488.1 dyslexia-associated protein KIAA0319 homolog isoform X2 [Anarrhichthys ocellatus]